MDAAPDVAIPVAIDDTVDVAEGAGGSASLEEGEPAMVTGPHADRVSTAATAKAPARLTFLCMMVQSRALRLSVRLSPCG